IDTGGPALADLRDARAGRGLPAAASLHGYVPGCVRRAGVDLPLPRLHPEHRVVQVRRSRHPSRPPDGTTPRNARAEVALANRLDSTPSQVEAPRGAARPSARRRGIERKERNVIARRVARWTRFGGRRLVLVAALATFGVVGAALALPSARSLTAGSAVSADP